MKNKLIIFGAAFLLLCLIAGDKLVSGIDDYNLRTRYNDSKHKVEAVIQQTDSISNTLDDYIQKSEVIKSKNKNANEKVDSIQQLLESTHNSDSRQIENLRNKLKRAQEQPVEVRMVKEMAKIEKLDAVHHPDMIVREHAFPMKDSTIYSITVKDSTILIYDTIRVIKMDTIIIEDPKHVKKIKRKYVD